MRKCISKDTQWAFEPIGAAKEVAACGGRAGQHGRPGLVRPDPRKNSNGSLIFNFKDFWNLAKVAEILQGDLEGIWTWGIFLNSYTLLKDF
jgi:hypothetical protein